MPEDNAARSTGTGSDASPRFEERPFSEWGQWPTGTLDLRVFDQQDYRVDIKQVPHRIADMSQEYRRNVIAFLHTHVQYYHACELRRRALEIIEAVWTGQVGGEVLALELSVAALTDLSPVEWLESTPLLRRLRASLQDG